MPEATKKMQELLGRIKGKIADKSPDMDSLASSLKEIKETLADLVLQFQIQHISEIVRSLGPNNKQEIGQSVGQKETQSDVSLAQAINNLEEISTSKKDKSGQRWFLLHRATEDYEYEASKQEGNEFKTDKDTEWVADYMKSEDNKQGANPTISCWVSETDIENIPNPHINVGTWGTLGKNPFASRYKVIVKPGTYQIHQEYRGE